MYAEDEAVTGAASAPRSAAECSVGADGRGASGCLQCRTSPCLPPACGGYAPIELSSRPADLGGSCTHHAGTPVPCSGRTDPEADARSTPAQGFRVRHQPLPMLWQCPYRPRSAVIPTGRTCPTAGWRGTHRQEEAARVLDGHPEPASCRSCGGATAGPPERRATPARPAPRAKRPIPCAALHGQPHLTLPTRHRLDEAPARLDAVRAPADRRAPPSRETSPFAMHRRAAGRDAGSNGRHVVWPSRNERRRRRLRRRWRSSSPGVPGWTCTSRP
jgi:hypothetical protein